MNEIIKLTKDQIAYLSIDELLNYYKQCVLSGEDFESIIENIEDEIKDRL